MLEKSRKAIVNTEEKSESQIADLKAQERALAKYVDFICTDLNIRFKYIANIGTSTLHVMLSFKMLLISLSHPLDWDI
jgi:hypothetical protein